jgi:hypothetical protein
MYRQIYPIGMNLCLTSRCNRRCPNCSVGVGFKSDSYDLNWDTIESLGEIFGYLPGGPVPGYTLSNIGYNITGGEPSFHKQFAEFAPKLRSVLKCNCITIATNGWGFTRFPEAFLAFDEIFVSLYGEFTFPGCPSNQSDIDFMINFLKSKGNPVRLQITPIAHYIRPSSPGPGTCFRSHDGYVTYWEGLIYPCCTAQGMVGTIGIPPTLDWKEKIMQIDLPCANCLFRSD